MDLKKGPNQAINRINNNIAVIIPFSYSACNITTFFLINAYLTRDLFKKLKADF